jgi:hypothetical protein
MDGNVISDDLAITWLNSDAINTYRHVDITKPNTTPNTEYELLLYNPSQTTNVVVNIYNKEAALGSGSRDCLLYGPITISKNVPTAVGAFKTYKAAGAGSYVTDTTHINEASANDVELVPVATVEDAAYFGAYLPFNAIKVDIGTAGNYVATTVWEYWNGSAWTALTVTDGTVSGGLTFAQDGVVSFSEPSDWATVAVDSTTMYWVRCRVSAFTSVATAPLCTQAWLMGAKTTTAQAVLVHGLFCGGVDARIVAYNDTVLGAADAFSLAVRVREVQ